MGRAIVEVHLGTFRERPQAVALLAKVRRRFRGKRFAEFLLRELNRPAAVEVVARFKDSSPEGHGIAAAAEAFAWEGVAP